MNIGFGNNDYGITRKEWKAFKKELKRADKQNDNFNLSKADYKEIKSHIKAGDLGAYMDKLGDDMRNAVGLSLSGKVDSLDAAQRIARDVKLDGADLDKVLKYIENAVDTPKHNEIAIQEMNRSLGGTQAPITGNKAIDYYTQTKPFINENFMELFA